MSGLALLTRSPWQRVMGRRHIRRTRWAQAAGRVKPERKLPGTYPVVNDSLRERSVPREPKQRHEQIRVSARVVDRAVGVLLVAEPCLWIEADAALGDGPAGNGGSKGLKAER